jgi:hypothetical protein
VSVGSFTKGTLNEQLVEQGRSGWELATIGDLGGDKFAIFKRAVEQLAR